jgi:hypothetical protein
MMMTDDSDIEEERTRPRNKEGKETETKTKTEKARGKNRSTKVAIDHEVQPSSTAGAVDLLLMRAGQSNLQFVKVAGEQTSNRIEIRNQKSDARHWTKLARKGHLESRLGHLSPDPCVSSPHAFLALAMPAGGSGQHVIIRHIWERHSTSHTTEFRGTFTMAGHSAFSTRHQIFTKSHLEPFPSQNHHTETRQHKTTQAN